MGFHFNKSILLENERVKLEPLSEEHLLLLQDVGAEDVELMRYSPLAVHTKELLSTYVQSALTERDMQTKYSFAIFDKLAGKYAGSTSFGNISNPDQRLEIGWTWIGRDFQRTGLNRNCKFLLLSHAFEVLAFERVEFKTDSRNLKSKKAIEQIGAIFEGEFRSHSIMSDGFRRNTVYYSILKNEWPMLKTTVFQDFSKIA